MTTKKKTTEGSESSSRNNIRKYFFNKTDRMTCPNITSDRTSLTKQPLLDNKPSDAVQTLVPNFMNNQREEECSDAQLTNQIVAVEETLEVQNFNQSVMSISNEKEKFTFSSQQLGEGLNTGLNQDQVKHERDASDVV